MEFQAWGKTPRLNKEAVYTEKIDGTNACVVIEAVDPAVEDYSDVDFDSDTTLDVVWPDNDNFEFAIGAQSRTRMLTRKEDNFGFAKWVQENSVDLVKVLGVGTHFGEWWGHGIQRGYGLGKGDRRFSLFNTRRWEGQEEELSRVYGLGYVPVLEKSQFDTETASLLVQGLRRRGSQAAPGFMRPEGVCVFHIAAQTVFKTFLENDQIPKGAQS